MGSRMLTACAARRWGFLRFVTTIDALRSPVAGGIALLARLRSISTLVAAMTFSRSRLCDLINQNLSPVASVTSTIPACGIDATKRGYP